MDKFNLDDWDCYFELKNIRAMAETKISHRGRTLNFVLNEKVEVLSLDETGLRETARHEVCHILIQGLDCLVAEYVTEDEHKTENEKLVVKLTKLLSDE